MASLDPDQAEVYQAYLRAYAAAAGAAVFCALATAEEPTPEPSSSGLDHDVAAALGAYDAKAGRSPRWSGEILASVRHMKDPSLGSGGRVGSDPAVGNDASLRALHAFTPASP